MENATFISGISTIIDGALYFSESENPFSVSDWGLTGPAALAAKIAAEHSADPSKLRQADAAAFFERIGNSPDPSDDVMVRNAAKLKNLYQYLRDNLRDIQVTRVEGSSRIPVIISGYLPDHTCIAIQTTAIET